MNKQIVRWVVSGQGTMKVDATEIAGMGKDEIEDYLREGVHLQIHEQNDYVVELEYDEDALEKMAMEG